MARFGLRRQQQVHRSDRSSFRFQRGPNLPVLGTGRVIEVQKEQEFQQTGIVDPKTAVKFANIMGVRYVVFGSGRANPTGSRSYHFLHEATITMLDAQSGEQVMVATWSGAGVEPVSAARKIGDEIAEKWTKR